MISKNRINYIRSLQDKKAREEEQLYVIEGDKLIKGYLDSGSRLKLLIALSGFIASLLPGEKEAIDEIEPASPREMERMSSFKTPHNAIAVLQMPQPSSDQIKKIDTIIIALESIQDPGNLGTILRAAAWFGFRYVVCSLNCADLYNPKVIQASMGALLNVTVLYQDLNKLLENAGKQGLPVYGTFLEGESVYASKPGNSGIIVFGNESKGISAGLLPHITDKLVIPKFTNSNHGVESLNVGMAASVIFSEFARKRS